MTKEKQAGSWEPISEWYDCLVGESGHYYHRHVILPGIRKLLHLEDYKTPSLLDLGCGQGILARAIPSSLPYTGVDISETLIESAKQKNRRKKSTFIAADASKPLPFKEGSFTHVTFILCLQNMADPRAALKQARKMVAPGGRIIVILNHPCFRVPRSSGWEAVKEHQVQYRTIGRYLSPLEVPIQATPSRGESSVVTPSFHYSLSTLFKAFASADLSVGGLEEWCSDKISEGGAAPMENRARREIPLFMALVAEPRGFPAPGPLGEETENGSGNPVALFDPEPLLQPVPRPEGRAQFRPDNRREGNRHKKRPYHRSQSDSRPPRKPGFRSHEHAEERANDRDEKRANWRSQDKEGPQRGFGKPQGTANRNRFAKKKPSFRGKKGV